MRDAETASLSFSSAIDARTDGDRELHTLANWNANERRLGATVTSPQFSPIRLKGDLESHQIGQVSCGEAFSLAVSKTGAGALVCLDFFFERFLNF